jgi:putative peptidoglycan lipid II flippase
MFFAALGLPFFGASRILVSAYYALQDTRTPVKIATLCLLINVLFNVILMFPMKIGGIALASSISGAANCYFLWRGLDKKMWRQLGPKG